MSVLSACRKLCHKFRLAKLKLRHKGRNVQIAEGFTFLCSDRIRIGNDVYIGDQAYISATGGLTIGSGTIIGPKLAIYTSNHNYKEADAIPYDDAVLPLEVKIGENCWIGGNVVITPGVEIGEGCVVGAGSVVTRNFPAFSILGGNPAKVIGSRNKDHYMRLKRQDRIYLALKSRGQMRPHLKNKESDETKSGEFKKTPRPERSYRQRRPVRW